MKVVERIEVERMKVEGMEVEGMEIVQSHRFFLLKIHQFELK